MCKDMDKSTIIHVLATIRDICNSCERCNHCPFRCMCRLADANDFLPSTDMDNEYIEKAVNKYMEVVNHE